MMPTAVDLSRPADADVGVSAATSNEAPWCWCISKGMAGMNSQTRGLAEAVGAPFEMRNCRMAPPWAWMPIGWVPRRLFTLRGFPPVTDSSPPRLVISCGRHGVVPSIALKRRFGDRLFTVHIQDPKVDPAAFDLVVAPKHDGVQGKNVYLTMGALHFVTDARLAAARNAQAAGLLRAGNRPLLTVLIGGRNKHYAFSEKDIESLASKLDLITRNNEIQLAIIGSNRTPPWALERMRKRFGEKHFVWDGTGANPYLSALGCASYLVVTGDSVSMISEAVSTGRPVFVHHLKEGRPNLRFRRFHAMFQDAGFTRPFTGELTDWRYDPPNDTSRIARLIKDRIGLE